MSDAPMVLRTSDDLEAIVKTLGSLIKAESVHGNVSVTINFIIEPGVVTLTNRCGE